MSSQTPAFVRTLVPFIVSFLLTQFALPIDGTTANAAVQAIIGYLYYAAVHIIELKFPKWGFLLGIAKAPAYAQGDPPQPAPEIKKPRKRTPRAQSGPSD